MIYKLIKVYTNDMYAQENLPCILKSKHLTLAISMLTNIFPLHAKKQKIISSIPMSYAQCDKVTKISL
jgi:hypothetical protein